MVLVLTLSPFWEVCHQITQLLLKCLDSSLCMRASPCRGRADLALALVHLVEGLLVAAVVYLHVGAQALPHRARWLLALHNITSWT